MKVSCIIPVYNEAERVLGVLKAVVGHPQVDEVIVVNDGSSDNSKAVLENQPGIRFFSYDKNRGKSGAIAYGLAQAKNELVMFIDSDLIGLSAQSIAALISPVTSGAADVSISLRVNSLPVYKMLGLDFVSGERVFHKDLIGDPEALTKLPGFGLEAFLNNKIIEKKLRLKVVHWDSVISPRKSAKAGWWAGTKADFKMVRQVVKTATLMGVIRQIAAMRALRVK